MSSDFFATLPPGTRVVVRYCLAPDGYGPAGEHFSDALGVLLEADAASVRIQTRTSEVLIDRTAITHAKLVPPPPVRRRGARG